jgi:hypothetical protein
MAIKMARARCGKLAAVPWLVRTKLYSAFLFPDLAWRERRVTWTSCHRPFPGVRGDQLRPMVQAMSTCQAWLQRRRSFLCGLLFHARSHRIFLTLDFLEPVGRGKDARLVVP